VVSQECCPALITARPPRRALWHVLPDRSWRDANAELVEELIGDPLLTPERILNSHAPNQLAKFHGNARTSSA
jgi:hypothetical protein